MEPEDPLSDPLRGRTGQPSLRDEVSKLPRRERDFEGHDAVHEYTVVLGVVAAAGSTC